MATTSKEEYVAAVNALLNNYADDLLAFSSRVEEILQLASDSLSARLLRMPKTVWTTFHFRKVEEELKRVLDKFQKDYLKVAQQSVTQSAKSGIELVTVPITDFIPDIFAGEVFAPVSMDFFTRQAMNLVTTRISGARGAVEKQILGEIISAMAGAKAPHQVIKKLANIIQGRLQGKTLGFKNLNSRAWTIFRTESVKIHNIATELQGLRAGQILPDMQKEWIHNAFGVASAGYTPRDWHVALDGERIEKEDFFVTAHGNPMRFPHDPQAPAEEVINCTCGHAWALPDKAFEPGAEVVIT